MIRLTLGTLDLDRGTLWVDEGARSLSPTEVALLRYLWEATGRPVHQRELLAEVWGYSPNVQTRTVRVTVSRLRNKIERDPAAPVHLLTQAGDGYRFVAEATARTDIPSDLVGRDKAIRLLQRSLDAGTRRLSLIGPPGVGKSRVAAVLADWSPGAVVIDLADAKTSRDLAERCAAVGITLGTPDGPDRVVVFDNADRVLDPVRDAVARWADGTVIVTARHPLRVRGEVIYEVTALEESDALLLLERLWRAERLDRPASGLAGMARQLDGLPLALTLAASWAGTISPKDLARRLSEGIEWLEDAADQQPPRHRSLAVAVGLSLDRLEASERALLLELTVFQDGFRPTEAEAVFGPGVLRGLKALRDHCLLVQSDGGRLRMLSAVRATLSGDPAPQTLHDHAAAYLAFARELAPGPAFHSALRRLEPERSNLLAAHAWSVATDPALAVELAVAMEPLWMRRGPADTHIAMLRATPEDPRIAVALARALRRSGDLEPAQRAAVRAVALDRSAASLRVLGRVHALSGAYTQARQSFEEALGLARHGPDPAALSEALYSLGMIDAMEGQLARSQGRLREALDLVVPLGDADRIGLVTAELADVLSMDDQLDQALVLFTSLPPMSPSVKAHVDERLAGCLHGLGRLDDALAALDRAWDHHRGGVSFARRSLLARRYAVELDLGHPGARATAEKRLAMAATTGDRLGAAVTHQRMALQDIETGDLEASRDHHAIATAFWRGAPPSTYRSYGHFWCGAGALLRGEAAEAVALLTAARDAAEASGNRNLATLACTLLGFEDPAMMPLEEGDGDARALAALFRTQAGQALPASVVAFSERSVLVRLFAAIRAP